MIYDIALQVEGHNIAMKFDLDPSFVADCSLKYYFDRGTFPEPEVVHLMLRAVRLGDTVIDAGANIGFFTILLSKLVGETGHVIAVEPSPRNLAKLRANIELNGCTNVEVIDKALSDKSGEMIKFYENPLDSGMDGCAGEKASFEVLTTTLDALCLDKTPRLLKLDIEGSETQALRGVKNLAEWHPDFIVCETNEAALFAMRSSVEGLRSCLSEFYDTFILSQDGSYPAHILEAVSLKPQRPNSNILFSLKSRVINAWKEARY